MVFKCIILLILKKYSSRWEMWTLSVCTLAHIHLPGIWMSRDHTWRSAHCTGTEHSCPCQQRWALGPLEKPRPAQRCGDGRSLRRIPAQRWQTQKQEWNMEHVLTPNYSSRWNISVLQPHDYPGRSLRRSKRFRFTRIHTIKSYSPQ